MTRPLHDLGDRRLAEALIHAGRALPGARRDVSGAVAGMLRTRPVPARLRVARGRRRRVVLVAVTLAALLAGAAFAARVVPGIDVRIGTPGPASEPLIDDAGFLGRSTTLPSARTQAGFHVQTPTLDRLGEPQVHVAGDGDRSRVSLVYPASGELPAIGETDAGLLITQFRGRIDADLLHKIVGAGVDVRRVDVGGSPGWWIAGTHEVLVVGPDGEVVGERARYAQRTLLWAADGVTRRLEVDVSSAEAVAIAESIE